MSAYRIYELTADDHVAAPPTIVDCPDDTAAIEKARQWLDRRIIEVWQVHRCVIRMQPTAERRRQGPNPRSLTRQFFRRVTGIKRALREY
jgi:hypothetical protein